MPPAPRSPCCALNAVWREADMAESSNKPFSPKALREKIDELIDRPHNP